MRYLILVGNVYLKFNDDSNLDTYNEKYLQIVLLILNYLNSFFLPDTDRLYQEIKEVHAQKREKFQRMLNWLAKLKTIF